MIKQVYNIKVFFNLFFNKRFPRFRVINVIKVFFIECVPNVVILKSFVRVIVSGKPVIEEKNTLVSIKGIILTVQSFFPKIHSEYYQLRFRHPKRV